MLPAVQLDESAQRWPGPSRYTLFAWIELELLLESGAQVDAAHAVITDGADRAFGSGWLDALAAAAAAEGCPFQDGYPSLVALRADEDLALRVLTRLHGWMRERAGEPGAAPAPPDLVWSADPGASVD